MLSHRFGIGVPFVPFAGPLPAFLVPAFQLTKPQPLVYNETMLYRLRGADGEASFFDTGIVVETSIFENADREVFSAWSSQLAPHLVVIRLSDVWRMNEPGPENEQSRVVFVCSSHFERGIY